MTVDVMVAVMATSKGSGQRPASSERGLPGKWIKQSE
jgi:hypothetical protein